MENKDDGLTSKLIELDRLLSNDLRVEILLILYMNKELSLNAITQFSGKSKSAISRQMKQLVEMNIIEAFEKNESTPGIQQKYYKINNSFNKIITYKGDQEVRNINTTDDTFNLEDYLQYIFVLNKVIPYLTKLNDKFIQYMLSSSSKEFSEGIDVGFLFVPDSAINDFANLTSKYIESVKDLMLNHKDNKSTFMCTLMVQPLARLLSLNN